MSNSKITALAYAITPLAGSETLPIVQSGVTKKVNVGDLTVGQTVTTGGLNVKGTQQLYDGNIWLVLNSDNTNYYYVTNTGATGAGNATLEIVLGGAGTVLKLDGSRNVTFTAGNLVQGTVAKGVNFTANTSAAGMTSQLLNWYEEGTWTPVVTVTGGSITQAIQGTPKFTRVGRLVNASGYVNVSVVNLPTGTVKITGLPYASATFAAATLALFTGGFTTSYSGYINNAGTFVTVTNFNAATLVGGENLIFSITYPTT